MFPPERAVDLAATYEGQNGKSIGWKLYDTPDQFGQLNLIQGIASCEEAVGYAYAELESPEARAARVRCRSSSAVIAKVSAPGPGLALPRASIGR